MEVKLSHHLWEGNEPVQLSLPENWRVEILRMQGDEKPVLTGDRYRTALSVLKPILLNKREICILFDDLSRPTKAFEVLPYLLEILNEYGIRDDQLRFICAVGMHGALDRTAFRKKLGEFILDRFPVYNHNPYENCEQVGTTRFGTPVIVNKEYLSCDLRIGIGSFLPHAFCGFGGGSKIVFPGVSHVNAITRHHGGLLRSSSAFMGLGRCKENPLLEDVLEYGRIAGFDAKIDVLVNTRGEHVDVHAGPPDGVHGAMMEKALFHYHTPVSGRADIVFANAYAKANEAAIAMSQAEALLKDSGGDIVALCDVEAGQAVHYLFGKFGKFTFGRLGDAGFSERPQSPKVRRIFIYSRYKDLAASGSFGKVESIIWVSNLNELIEQLDKEYQGSPVEAFVLPDATIQIV